MATRMATRLDEFYRKNIGLILNNAEFYQDPWWEARQIIVAGLENGDIEKPEWLIVSTYTDWTRLQDEADPDYAIIINHGERF